MLSGGVGVGGRGKGVAVGGYGAGPLAGGWIYAMVHVSLASVSSPWKWAKME